MALQVQVNKQSAGVEKDKDLYQAQLDVFLDPNDPEQAVTAEHLSELMVRRAIRLGGTCTGEHGIGLHKIGYLVEEAGDGAVALMRQIKRALDPLNIMNPGKVLAL